MPSIELGRDDHEEARPATQSAEAPPRPKRSWKRVALAGSGFVLVAISISAPWWWPEAPLRIVRAESIDTWDMGDGSRLSARAGHALWILSIEVPGKRTIAGRPTLLDPDHKRHEPGFVRIAASSGSGTTLSFLFTVPSAAEPVGIEFDGVQGGMPFDTGPIPPRFSGESGEGGPLAHVTAPPE